MAIVGTATTWTDTGAVTPAGALPSSNTTATNTNTVGLSWAAITGATGYKIYRATATGGQSTSPALVASVGAVTTYTDTGTAVTAGAVPANGPTPRSGERRVGEECGSTSRSRWVPDKSKKKSRTSSSPLVLRT